MSEFNPQDLVEEIEYSMDEATVIPMPIDPTLSNPGEAADAKATGDAIRAVGGSLDINGVTAVNGSFKVYSANIPMNAAQGAQTLETVVNEISGRTGEDIQISEDSVDSIAQTIENAVDTLSEQIESVDQTLSQGITDSATTINSRITDEVNTLNTRINGMDTTAITEAEIDEMMEDW